jgi:predicted ATP-dependent endonuclease of OLD family
MNIIKFEIKNYRAIEQIEINLNYSINPIIGINEAGKTSVLRAILAFDKTRDRFNDGEHLEYKNKYLTKATKNSEVSAVLTLDKKEVEKLLKSVKLKTDSTDYTILSKYSNKTELLLTRKLTEEKKEYHFEDQNLTESTNAKVTKFLVSNLPYILYFDDFADRVPQTVEFPIDYYKTGKLTRNKNRDWQDIIQEIFKRADTEGIDEDYNEIPLQTYFNIKDADTKTDILSDVEQTLNNEIIKEWKRIKKSGQSFADDSDKLELVLENEGDIFYFKVKDKSHKDKKRTFNISERSKGFQWFFNYMIKLKFNPNYKGELKNSIFLLDEPGSYLHSTAQSELLKELERVSKDNFILFCTHSQYLLNPEIIKLGSIKIAEKKESKITLQNYGNYKSKKDKGALSPIYQALQLNFAHDFLGKVVITEGITDFYLLKIIQKHTKLIPKNITIIPSSGAGHSSTLISLAIPFSDSFLILLDNDKAGKNAKTKYLKEFGEGIESNIHFYNSTIKDFKLENFLCSKDSADLLRITNSTDLKRAFGFIYYDYKDEQNKFISKLSKETLENFKSTFKIISEL